MGESIYYPARARGLTRGREEAVDEDALRQVTGDEIIERVRPRSRGDGGGRRAPRRRSRGRDGRSAAVPAGRRAAGCGATRRAGALWRRTGGGGAVRSRGPRSRRGRGSGRRAASREGAG